FLRTLNHLEKPDEGWVKVDGVLMGYEQVNGRPVELPDARVSLQRRFFGMVFQQFNLFSHLTALENISVAPINALNVGRAEAVAARRWPRPGDCFRWSASRRRRAPPPTSSLAASSSGSRSPALSRSNPRSCCSTSRPRRSIRRW